MKMFFSCMFLVFTGACFGQTLKIEKENVARLVATDPVKYSEHGRDFLAFVKKNGYPTLPYDSASNELVYQSVVACPGMKMGAINERVREWVAINFGRYSQVMHYESDPHGKIIVKGFFEMLIKESVNLGWFFGKSEWLTVARIYSTYVFTVKDGYLKMDILNGELEREFGGYSTGSTYTPRTKVSTGLNYYFPITNQDPERWKGLVDILKNTDAEINATYESVGKYVNGRAKDYEFGQ